MHFAGKVQVRRAVQVRDLGPIDHPQPGHRHPGVSVPFGGQLVTDLARHGHFNIEPMRFGKFVRQVQAEPEPEIIAAVESAFQHHHSETAGRALVRAIRGELRQIDAVVDHVIRSIQRPEDLLPAPDDELALVDDPGGDPAPDDCQDPVAELGSQAVRQAGFGYPVHPVEPVQALHHRHARAAHLPQLAQLASAADHQYGFVVAVIQVRAYFDPLADGLADEAHLEAGRAADAGIIRDQANAF